MSVSWGFIFIVVGWKRDYKVVGMDRDKFYFIVILWKYDYKAAGKWNGDGCHGERQPDE